MDEIIRAVSGDGYVKMTAISARGMVQRAREIHDLSPVASAALGRTLCAASMLGDALKEDEASLTVRINGGGPLGSIIAVSDSSGNVRGYVQNGGLDIPRRSDGKLDVGGAVGRSGMLTVTRDFGIGEPYVGSTQLVSGEIAEDFTRYLVESEQVGSACGLGVLVDTDLSILAAGGYIIQLLPGSGDEHIEAIEAGIGAMPPVTEILNGSGDARLLVDAVLPGLEPRILDSREVQYRCYCSRQRVMAAVSSVGSQELEEMRTSGEETSVSCQFCDKIYNFSPEDIAEILKNLENDAPNDKS